MNYIVVETRVEDGKSLDISAFLFFVDARAFIKVLKNRGDGAKFTYSIYDSRKKMDIPI